MCCATISQSSWHPSLCLCVLLQMEYERQVASVRAQNALEGDFSISQAEMSSRQAMLENASDIKVTYNYNLLSEWLKMYLTLLLP